MKKIKINNSKKEFIIDDEDFERVILYSWHLCGRNKKTLMGYFCGNHVHIARFILKYAGKYKIDHKDRNIFNNQKENFRLSTNSENGINAPKTNNNTSGYKGVYWHNREGKWRAQISNKGKGPKTIGSYFTKEEAAEAYNREAIKLYGEFAYLNVIDTQKGINIFQKHMEGEKEK